VGRDGATVGLQVAEPSAGLQQPLHHRHAAEPRGQVQGRGPRRILSLESRAQRDRDCEWFKFRLHLVTQVRQISDSI